MAPLALPPVVNVAQGVVPVANTVVVVSTGVVAVLVRAVVVSGLVVVSQTVPLYQDHLTIIMQY